MLEAPVPAVRMILLIDGAYLDIRHQIKVFVVFILAAFAI